MSERLTEPCKHQRATVKIDIHHFEDRPGQACAQISGVCNDCGALLHFHGTPWAISTTRPCVNLDGTVLSVPVTYGEQPFDTKGAIEIGCSVQLGPEAPRQ